MIREVWKKYRQRCEVIRVRKLRNDCALKLTTFIKSIISLRGPTRKCRDIKHVRCALALNDVMTKDLQEEKATKVLKKFFINISGKMVLENKMK